MPDPVNAADVLAGRWAHDPTALTDAWEQVQRLLAYGDGDPVVVMPDGTLRALHLHQYQGGGRWSWGLADPVVSDD